MVSTNRISRIAAALHSVCAFVAIVAIQGCGSGGGNNAPQVNTIGLIVGKWAIPRALSVPGSSTTLDLHLTGTTVYGTGTYAIEAGRSGVLTVNGSSSGSIFELTFAYDYGVIASYKGTLPDANDMTGMFQEGSNSASPLKFVRQ